MINSVEQLSQLALDNDCKIILLDGYDGAGKTFITNSSLITENFSVLHVDDFIVPGQGKYVCSIKFDELKEAIVSSTKPLIIEGCCLLNVADSLSLDFDYHVYFKRMEAGIWINEDDCNISSTPEEYIRLINQDVEALSIILNKEYEKENEFRFEIIKYHYEKRPQDHASLIFGYEQTSS